MYKPLCEDCEKIAIYACVSVVETLAEYAADKLNIKYENKGEDRFYSEPVYFFEIKKNLLNEHKYKIFIKILHEYISCNSNGFNKLVESCDTNIECLKSELNKIIESFKYKQIEKG